MIGEGDSFYLKFWSSDKSLAICLLIITKTTSDEQTDIQKNGPTELS